jgi:hypothetical protein
VSPVMPVLPASLAPYAGADVTASVAQPSPTPTGPTGELRDFEVSPGLLGFLPPFLIALACVGLFLSLTRHLRRVNVRQAQIDAAEAEAARSGEDHPGEVRGPGDDRPGEPRRGS